MIAVNQDPLGVQGHRVNMTSDGAEVWAGPLADHSVCSSIVKTVVAKFKNVYCSLH